MKVIGLINRIYEGTQPQHIRVYNQDWYWNNYDGYVTKESLKTTPDAQTYLFDMYRMMFALDKEVEVIEDNDDLELIPDDELYLGDDILHYDAECMDYNFRVLKDKINELVKEIKENK